MSTKGKTNVTPRETSREIVGARLRALRKARGLTLKKLSEASGIPLSTLSKIELAQASLSYDKFMIIARALGTEMTDLLRGDTSGADVPVYTGQLLKTSIQKHGEYASDNYQHKFLFSGISGKDMTPIIATVNSREINDFSEFIKHPGQEFALVLSGAVKIVFENGESVHLKKDEAAYFDSSIGHVYLSCSKQPARVMAVCSDRFSEGINA